MRDGAREVESVELDLLLEGVFLRWGYDFRSWSRVHVKRRVEHFQSVSGAPTISSLQDRLLRDEEFFRSFLDEMSIQVSEMFRDPRSYAEIRRIALPALATWPRARIWHAGCAAGEEVYSMAIMLEEEGLLGRTVIYATDFSESALRRAREGVFPAKRVREFTENYLRSGGKAEFSGYYAASYGSGIIAPRLREAVTFARHNLASDGVFGEMNMIVCRNVLIYFDRSLQARAAGLFADSLCPGGLLWIGSKESLALTGIDGRFETLSEEHRLYRKRYDRSA